MLIKQRCFSPMPCCSHRRESPDGGDPSSWTCPRDMPPAMWEASDCQRINSMAWSPQTPQVIACCGATKTQVTFLKLVRQFMGNVGQNCSPKQHMY